MNKIKLENIMNKNLDTILYKMKNNSFNNHQLLKYNVAEYFSEYIREVGIDYASKYFSKKFDRTEKICEKHNIHTGKFMLEFYFNIIN